MEVEEFLKEAAVMKEIKHPNLVQLLGTTRYSIYHFHLQEEDPYLTHSQDIDARVLLIAQSKVELVRYSVTLSLMPLLVPPSIRVHVSAQACARGSLPSTSSPSS